MKGKSKRQKKIKNIFKRLKRQWKKQITIWKKERDDKYESRKSVENYNASNCRIDRIFRKNKRKIKREGDDCYDKKIFTTYSIIIVNKRKVVKDEKKT